VYPQYGFERHKGYTTAEHLLALGRFGPTPQHRFTFEPVLNSCPRALRRDAASFPWHPAYASEPGAQDAWRGVFDTAPAQPAAKAAWA
jgi:ribonuclease HII